MRIAAKTLYKPRFIPHNPSMNKTTLLFHIDRQGGLEFVFTSGEALSYPMHVHASVYTITVVREGLVRLPRPGHTDFYKAGSIYTVAPHEPHSPAYLGAFDIVSLCVKANLSRMDHAALAAHCLKYARLLMERELLSLKTTEDLLRGLTAMYDQSDVGSLAAITTPEILKSWAARKAGGPTSLDASPPLSRFHFIRKFKHETGLTPHQYVIQNRVRQAKKFLNETSIAEAAMLAGFCDQSHLNRCFKRNIGITPQSYQKSCFFWNT